MTTFNEIETGNTGLTYHPVRKDAEWFDQFMDLYQEAFPPNEFIEFYILENIMSENRNVRLDAVFDGRILVGMRLLFIPEGCTFVGFLGTRSDLRSKGYGSRILSDIKSIQPSNPIVLNIEPPDEECDNLDQRIARLRFYNRNGLGLTNQIIEIDGDTYRIMCSDPISDLGPYREFATKMQWNIRERPYNQEVLR